MFTGITKGIFLVMALTKAPGLTTYTVSLSPELATNLKVGDSVSVDGVCQTAVKLDNNNVTFQAMQETLDKTTLNDLKVGSYVSIERSLHFGDEIGGHEVSGHVFGTAEIKKIIAEENNYTLVIKCNTNWMKYILPKGFIAIDGSSLTVGQIFPDQGLFYIHLIPETLRLTNFGKKQVGDKVNIEFDYKTKTIVDTVERVVAQMKHNLQV